MLSNRLQQILATKHEEVSVLRPKWPHLRAAALQRNDFRSLRTALNLGENALSLIAEVKKASPSAGVIAESFNPDAIALAYQDAGAHALSVLTDEQYFKGHLSYLKSIREKVGIPVLRKDFIIHESQIAEAAVAGADAILLIVAALDDERLAALYEEASILQLECLVEVHDLRELDRALDLGAEIIGINNRNLVDFTVNLETTASLSEQVPDDLVLVSESGIKTGADTQKILDWGCNAILVGETLMRSDDIAATVGELLHQND
jgi:indole-3-glycerol phosphate synthase